MDFYHRVSFISKAPYQVPALWQEILDEAQVIRVGSPVAKTRRCKRPTKKHREFESLPAHHPYVIELANYEVAGVDQYDELPHEKYARLDAEIVYKQAGREWRQTIPKLSLYWSSIKYQGE